MICLRLQAPVCLMVIALAWGASPVFNANVNLGACFFSDLADTAADEADGAALHDSARISRDLYQDITLSLGNSSGTHKVMINAGVFSNRLTSHGFKFQIPSATYKIQSLNKGAFVNAGRFNQISGFDYAKVDGASMGATFLGSFHVEGAAGALVDSNLAFGGAGNLAGYAALEKDIGVRNRVGLSFSRAERYGRLIANDLGVQVQLSTERRWHLRMGGKATITDGYKLTESYGRLTFKPKKRKQQYFVGTRSFFPVLYDPTTLYYFEYLHYNLAFTGGSWQFPLGYLLNLQAEVRQSGDTYTSNVSGSLVQRILLVRAEKGVTGRPDDYLFDAQAKVPILKGFQANPGIRIVHYDSYATASYFEDVFSSFYITTELNFPQSFLMRLKIEDRINRERIEDCRLFVDLSYTFSTEPADKFPWEY